MLCYFIYLFDFAPNFRPNVRPPPEYGSKGPVNVSVALVPQYVEGIEQSEMKFTALVAVDLYWNDPRLRWDPSKFDGLECIFMEYQEIWTPEVRFTLTMRDESDMRPKSLVRVCSEGITKN